MTHINQSQIKQWRRCQKAWDYRFGQRLVPKRKDRPMYLGSWIHACLETHYRDGDWRFGHNQYLTEYNKLFLEERADLDGGKEPLPSQVERIIAGYLHRYQNSGWKVVAVEKTWRVDVWTKRGIIPLGGRVDRVEQDPEGNNYVVDSKSTSSIPNEGSFHAMDPQLILYPWGIEHDPEWGGMKIAGIVYDYIRSKAPSFPKLNNDKTISKAAVATDYLTMRGFLEANGKDLSEYSELLAGLQESDDFLRRYRLHINAAATDRIVFEALRTARNIMVHSDTVRNVSRDCDRCAYRNLCRADLFGLDTSFMRKSNFTVEVIEEEDHGDPSAD